jgi:hypothetical protein
MPVDSGVKPASAESPAAAAPAAPAPTTMVAAGGCGGCGTTSACCEKNRKLSFGHLFKGRNKCCCN